MTGPAGVERYGDMLAAVLAAQAVTDGSKPGDADAHARVVRLLQPVAHRLDQLNDHQGRLARFGAGNIAGQTALDMAQAAVDSWLRRIALGARVSSDELVTRFRAGAEPIRFLTGERSDAPTLRAFDRASRGVGIGAAALLLGPALTAAAAEEAVLLAFAGRLAAQRVAMWALANPAAALAAAEAMLGFGVQIGEDGWEAFWGQLQDPQGRWFVIAQVFMDYMHVRGGLSGHEGADPGGARQRADRVRAVLQQVHDAAGSHGETDAGEPSRPARPARPAAPSEPPAAHEPPATHEPPRTGANPAGAAHGDHDLASLLPADLRNVEVTRSTELHGTEVVVRYRHGTVQIEAGFQATARHVAYHATTVRRLQRFQGPLGLARRLVDSVRTKLRLTPGYGTAGFEGRAEVAKLMEIERELVTLRTRLEDGDTVRDAGRTLDASAVDAELAQVQDQLEVEAARIDSYEPGKGFVAVRDLPVYPVAVDEIESITTEDSKQFAIEFVSRTKEGKQISLGYGYVDPLPVGEQTPVTRYVIDRFIQRFKARFGHVPRKLGGMLAWENKRNFQVEFIKCMLPSAGSG